MVSDVIEPEVGENVGEKVGENIGERSAKRLPNVGGAFPPTWFNSMIHDSNCRFPHYRLLRCCCLAMSLALALLAVTIWEGQG